MSRREWVLIAVIVGLLAVGCEDLSEFRTDGDDVFRGEVVGGEAGDPERSFIRRGFASRTRLELTFHPARANSNPGELRLTDPEGVELAAASLMPIEPLPHDTLSQYEFPGGGRLRNYIFGTRLRVAGELHDTMVFLSLMEDGSVDVRLISPDGALFGVFPLELERER